MAHEDAGQPNATAPRSVESRDFRRVLGHLPTGVVVITATHDDEPVGMACNSFTSVSLAPPLVLFSAAKTSTTWPRIRAAGRFCVNVMAEHHEPVAQRFATVGAERFEGVDVDARYGGPGIADAVAWIDCDIAGQHEGGDHDIVLGAVRRLEARPGCDPLIFLRGSYGAFAGPRADSAEPGNSYDPPRGS